MAVSEVRSMYETVHPCVSCGKEFIPARPERRSHITIPEYCSEPCRLRIEWRRRARPLTPAARVSGTSADSPISGEAKNLVLSSERRAAGRTYQRRETRPALTALPPRPERTPTGRRPWSEAARWRKGSRMLGISFEAYREQVQAGNRWCSRCRRWQSISEFGPHKRYVVDTVCLESSRTAARDSIRKRRAGGSA